MQWDDSKHAGFSTDPEAPLYLPVITSLGYDYRNTQRRLQRLGALTRFIIASKRCSLCVETYAVSWGEGEMRFLETGSDEVLAFERRLEDTRIWVVANMSDASSHAEFDRAEAPGRTPRDLFSDHLFPELDGEGSYVITLGPYQFYWLEISASPPRTV